MRHVLFAVAWVLFCSMSVRAAEPDSSGETPGTDIDIPAITKPAVIAGTETKTLRTYLEQSLKLYKDSAAMIDGLEAQLKTDVDAAKDNIAKADLTLAYLRKRKDFIDKIQADFKYTQDQLTKGLASLNSIVGTLGQQGGLLENAAKAKSRVEEQITNIEKLQREYRTVKAKQVKPGQPGYLDWQREYAKARADFKIATGELQRSVYKAHIYGKLAAGMKLTEEQTAGWQVYTAEMAVVFNEQALDLATAAEMTQVTIDYLEATRVFSEVEDYTKFAKQFKDVLGRITSELPPVPTVDVTKPPTWDIVPDIETFVARKAAEDYEKKMETPKPK